jgi:hypothetical protein
MANFSAAFGYDFYIVPVQNALITNFAAAPVVDSATPPAAADSVSYTDGVFSIASTPYTMDGSDSAIRLAGLTSASLETDTGTEDIYTYDDETSGFNQSVATTKSFSISLGGLADFGDSGYKVLRLTEQNTVADGLRVAFKRVGPTGTDETIVGYGTLTGYTESNEVSSIVSWECTLTGYGPYHLTLDTTNAPA